MDLKVDPGIEGQEVAVYVKRSLPTIGRQSVTSSSAGWTSGLRRNASSLAMVGDPTPALVSQSPNSKHPHHLMPLDERPRWGGSLKPTQPRERPPPPVLAYPHRLRARQLLQVQEHPEREEQNVPAIAANSASPNSLPGLKLLPRQPSTSNLPGTARAVPSSVLKAASALATARRVVSIETPKTVQRQLANFEAATGAMLDGGTPTDSGTLSGAGDTSAAVYGNTNRRGPRGAQNVPQGPKVLPSIISTAWNQSGKPPNPIFGLLVNVKITDLYPAYLALSKRDMTVHLYGMDRAAFREYLMLLVPHIEIGSPPESSGNLAYVASYSSSHPHQPQQHTYSYRPHHPRKAGDHLGLPLLTTASVASLDVGPDKDKDWLLQKMFDYFESTTQQGATPRISFVSFFSTYTAEAVSVVQEASLQFFFEQAKEEGSSKVNSPKTLNLNNGGSLVPGSNNNFTLGQVNVSGTMPLTMLQPEHLRAFIDASVTGTAKPRWLQFAQALDENREQVRDRLLALPDMPAVAEIPPPRTEIARRVMGPPPPPINAPINLQQLRFVIYSIAPLLNNMHGLWFPK